MNIGIIIYSQTGNTKSVALKLKEKLSAAGHSVDTEQIEISGELGPRATNFQLKTKPDVDKYDALVFGAPVQAFSLTPAMKSCLTQMTSLKGKKVACFVTKGLPFYWTGGNQAINKMEKICKSKDGEVCGSEMVIWSSKRRDQKITEVIEKLSKLF
ncbi:MAG: flavodoxin family protein [Atribacterota bacterium]|jgi:NAD(P)H dehydrogenase (quinone)